jgi:hypothetical protein
LAGVTDRLNNIKREKMDSTLDYDAPNDLITWMLQAALDLKDTAIEDPGPLVKRFTLVVYSHTLLDLSPC